VDVRRETFEIAQPRVLELVKGPNKTIDAVLWFVILRWSMSIRL
jgi:hypothetical protein